MQLMPIFFMQCEEMTKLHLKVDKTPPVPVDCTVWLMRNCPPGTCYTWFERDTCVLT